MVSLELSTSDLCLSSSAIMKPISLHGHERSITQIRYNREGDLLFSAAKDQYPNVWYAINGERLGKKSLRNMSLMRSLSDLHVCSILLGTYGNSNERDGNSHSGAVWCLDVDWETRHFLSGAADNTIRLWDVCTGKMLNRYFSTAQYLPYMVCC